jgi:hypothetical protein
MSVIRDNDDITFVTFNYRLNIFGQPNAPQLNGTGKAQNFGLLDIDAAIQWVHANIGQFGGDPNRITVMGQSAGGVAVDAYTFAHPNDTIVKGEYLFRTLMRCLISCCRRHRDFGKVCSLLRLRTGPAVTFLFSLEGSLSNGTILDPTGWNLISSAVGCGVSALIILVFVRLLVMFFSTSYRCSTIPVYACGQSNGYFQCCEQ